MRKFYISFGLLTAIVLAAVCGASAIAAEGGITTVKVESDVVSIPHGETVSVTSSCTPGKTLISGGGVCLGFLNTEDKVALSVSAPSPDAKNEIGRAHV